VLLPCSQCSVADYEFVAIWTDVPYDTVMSTHPQHSQPRSYGDGWVECPTECGLSSISLPAERRSSGLNAVTASQSRLVIPSQNHLRSLPFPSGFYLLLAVHRQKPTGIARQRPRADLFANPSEALRCVPVRCVTVCCVVVHRGVVHCDAYTYTIQYIQCIQTLLRSRHDTSAISCLITWRPT
jgi:hypothetical protein